MLLPDDLFVNLLDIDLQEQILNAKDLDIDIKNVIETIRMKGPINLLNNITDWKIEEVNGQKTIFYKGKNYIPKDQDLQCDIVKMFHDHKQLDTQCYNFSHVLYFSLTLYFFFLSIASL